MNKWTGVLGGGAVGLAVAIAGYVGLNYGGFLGWPTAKEPAAPTIPVPTPDPAARTLDAAPDPVAPPDAAETGITPPETAERDATAETAAVAETPSAQEPGGEAVPAALAPPTFGVRVEPDGATLVAGQGAAAAMVTIFLDGAEITTTRAGQSGKFAALMDLPPSRQPRLMTLAMRVGDKEIFAETEIIVAPFGPKSAPMEVAEAASDADRVTPEAETDEEIAALDDPAVSTREAVATGGEGSNAADATPAPEQPAAEAEPPGERPLARVDAPATLPDSETSVAQAPPPEPAAPASPDIPERTEAAVAKASQPGTSDAVTEAEDATPAPAEVPGEIAGTAPAAAGDTPDREPVAAAPAATEDPPREIAAADPPAPPGDVPVDGSDAAATPPGEEMPEGATVAIVDLTLDPEEPREDETAVADTLTPDTPVAETVAKTETRAPAAPGAEERVGTERQVSAAPGDETHAEADAPAQDTPDEASVAEADPAPEEQAVTQTETPSSEAQAPEVATVAEAATPAPADTAAAQDTPPTLLASDEEGVRVLPGPEVLDRVAIDTISYDDVGDVALAGRGAGSVGGGFVRVYLDNTPITSSRIRADGSWRVTLPDVDKGIYTLRVDEVDEEGEVRSRAETPFEREDRDTLERAARAANGVAPVKIVTVQPGNTLWQIARDRYGEGILYVRVFKANRGQIRDPDLIYPGQVFDLPEDQSAPSE